MFGKIVGCVLCGSENRLLLDSFGVFLLEGLRAPSPPPPSASG